MRTVTAVSLLALGLCWSQLIAGDQKNDDKAAAAKLLGGKAPTEFKSADKQQMFVLKKLEK